MNNSSLNNPTGGGAPDYSKRIGVGAGVKYYPEKDGLFVIYRNNVANAGSQAFRVYDVAGNQIAAYTFNHGNYQTTSAYADVFPATKGFGYLQDGGSNSSLDYYPNK